MKESVRDRILQVSERLFYKQGYNLTGINQIIAEAGIAKGSLYNHFKSKEELLMSYLESIEKEWFSSLNAFLEQQKKPEDKLLGLFDFRMKAQMNSGFLGCRFVKVSVEVPKDSSEVLSFIAGHKKKYAGIIDNILSEMDLPVFLQKEDFSMMVLLMIEGASVLGISANSSLQLERSKQIISGLLKK